MLSGLDSRVPCLAWNQWVVSAGSRAGQLQHSDVRVAEHAVARVQAHAQEVCGLAWSPDGRHLASGGNDNVLNIWEAEAGQCYAGAAPTHSLTSHQAAVKALAWCPWQSNILASGAVTVIKGGEVIRELGQGDYFGEQVGTDFHVMMIGIIQGTLALA